MKTFAALIVLVSLGTWAEAAPRHRFRYLPYPPPPCYGCGQPEHVFNLRRIPREAPVETRNFSFNPRASHTGGTED